MKDEPGSTPVARPSTSRTAEPTPLEQAQRRAEQGDVLSTRGQLREAVEQFAEAVRLAPDTAQFHYKLACAAWNADQFNLIEPHLLEAARLDPQNSAVQEGLALWFLRQGQVEAALRHIAAALAARPTSIQFIVTRADILMAAGQTQSAWQLLAPLIDAGISGTRLARIFAKLAPAVGQEQRAVAYIEQALGVPGLVATNDAPRLHFAAAALLEKLGRFEEAFAQALRANETSRREFDRAGYSQSVSLRIDYYTKARLKALPRATHGNRRPVLIVGMPRSGTSLVEQILATHPAVFGAGESTGLVDISLSAPQAPWSQGQSFPACSDFMSLQNANELAAPYLSTLQSLNASATYVTDFLFLP